MWRWDSDPFGTTAANTNPSGQGIFIYNPAFPGQYYDAESGQMYNIMRDYDPQVGRYVESDLVGLRGGVNTYAYVTADPMSLIDVLGLICTKAGLVLRDDTTNVIDKTRELGILKIPFIGPVSTDLGPSVEPPLEGRLHVGIGLHFTWQIVDFFFERYSHRQGWVHTQFFDREYDCKSDDPCNKREWVELRNEGDIKQDAFSQETTGWKYLGMFPSGYTISSP